MTAPGAVLGFVLTLAATTATGQQAPPRDVGPPRSAATPTGTGSIVGRVIDAESGTPLRRVEIVATQFNRPQLTAWTDDDGRYALTGVDAGVWQLAAGKSGYVRQLWGQARPANAPRPLNVRPDASIGADFTLVRAGAIGGRIYDEYGEPLAGVRVQILRARISQHRRYLQPIGEGDLTDDTGSFRLHGLAAGEYFLTASLRVAPADSIVQTTYAPSYYPGTASFAEAQRIVLAPGSDVVVDFPVMPYRTARVSGTVIAASGSPADAFLNLSAEAGELGVPLGVGGATLPDGTFTLPDVPPGTYTLTAELKGGSGAESASIPLTVYGDDVGGITLVTARPGTMKGVIVADADVRAPLPDTVSIVALSTRASGDATFAEPAGNVFDLTVPGGPFRLFVEPPAGWMVKSVVVADTDATDVPFDLRGQRDVAARVVLTNRVSEVRGSILAPDGRPGAGGASVVVFPYDSGLWPPPSRFVRTAAAAADGSFSITALPPGAGYLAVAVAALEDGEGEDPEFLARIRDRAIRFDLAEGEIRVLDLEVIPR